MKKVFLGVFALLAFASCQNEKEEMLSDSLSEEKEIVDLGKVDEDSSDVEVLAILKASDFANNGLKSSGGYYYSDLKVLAANSSDVPDYKYFNNRSYSVWKIDLNEGAAGKYIYLYCAYTNNKSDALTHLRADYDNSSWNTSRVVSGYSAVTNFDGHWVDLNEGAGGKFVYLSESKRTTCGEPITNLMLTRSSDKIAGGTRVKDGVTFYSVGSSTFNISYPNSDVVDLNMGTKQHKKYITLWYSK